MKNTNSKGLTIIIMNKDFFNNYQLTAGIHTISIKTSDDFNEMPEMSKPSLLYNTDMKTIKINLNKTNGFITSFAEYQDKLNTMLHLAGITDYKITRVDMCFDNYDRRHYLQYAKLNRLLISMIAQAYTVQNIYKTVDLFTTKQLSVAIKNPNSFEVENYDKVRESMGKDITKSRFEIRSLRMADKDIVSEFNQKWDLRFNTAINHFEDTLQRYNNSIFEDYIDEPMLKWTTFFLMHRNRIFTKQQAIDLLKMMNIPNPEVCYKYFKKRYRLETYTINDVQYILNEIKRARAVFFEGKKLPHLKQAA